MRVTIICLIMLLLCQNLLFSLDSHSSEFTLLKDPQVGKTWDFAYSRGDRKTPPAISYFEKDPDKNATRESGTFLIYLGGAMAVVGVTLLAQSFSDIALIDTKKYRNPGIILTAGGVGLMGLGFILRKSGSSESHVLGFKWPAAGPGIAVVYSVTY